MRILLYTFLLFFTLFLSIGYTQENTPQKYTTWGLPDGAKMRIGKGEIAAIQFSPDSSLLAVASSVGIWLYDVETGRELVLLPRYREGFNTPVFSELGRPLTFSPDGKLLASASEDDTIRVFDVTTYTEMWTHYKSKKSAVNRFEGTPHISLAFSANGQTLTSLEGTDERRIKVWNVNSGALLSDVSGRIGVTPLETMDPKQYNPLLALTLSPDGLSFAATKSKINFVNGIPETEINFGNVHTGELEPPVIKIRSIPENTDPNQQKPSFFRFSELIFSPDGTTLASIGISNSHERNKNSQRIRDTKIRIWYVSTGREVTTIIPQQSLVSPRKPIFSFSPDGRTFVTADRGAQIQLWDVSTGSEIKSITIPELKHITSWHKGGISTLAFHPNGKTLAVVIKEAEGIRLSSLQLWDIRTGKINRILIEHPMLYPILANERNILCMNADTFEKRDTNNGRKLQDLTKEWTNLLQHFRKANIDVSAVSSDFVTYTIGGKRGLLELYHTQKRKRLQRLKGHTDNITAVAFSTDGRKLASGSKDKSIRIWDTKTGTQLLTLTEHANSGKVVEFSNALPQASAEVLDNLVFSIDGNTLAGSSEYGTIWLWDLNTGHLLKTIITHEEETDILHGGMGGVKIRLAFSPDARLLASGNMLGRIILSDVKGDSLPISLEPHALSVRKLAFSPDGKILASCSKDFTIRLWDTVTGHRINTLRGHTGSVELLTFSEDGTTFVSGSKDGTILFWDRDKIVALDE